MKQTLNIYTKGSCTIQWNLWNPLQTMGSISFKARGKWKSSYDRVKFLMTSIIIQIYYSKCLIHSTVNSLLHERPVNSVICIKFELKSTSFILINQQWPVAWQSIRYAGHLFKYRLHEKGCVLYTKLHQHNYEINTSNFHGLHHELVGWHDVFDGS